MPSGGVFSNPNNISQLILEIQAGEGGKDSKLFVNDLLSAYLKYAVIKGLKSELLSSEEGHVIVKFSGKDVWKTFSQESGKHVIQRVPPTERSGRWQTSVLSIAVLPLPPVSKKDEIPEKDLDIKMQCGGGPGGQKVNKSASCARIRHIPTGINVLIMGRDFQTNKAIALQIVTARVNALHNDQASSAYGSNRKKQMAGQGKVGGRGEKVRTINMIKNRVVDHRLGLKTSNVKEYMKGNFDVLFKSGEQADAND